MFVFVGLFKIKWEFVVARLIYSVSTNQIVARNNLIRVILYLEGFNDLHFTKHHHPEYHLNIFHQHLRSCVCKTWRGVLFSKSFGFELKQLWGCKDFMSLVRSRLRTQRSLSPLLSEKVEPEQVLVLAIQPEVNSSPKNTHGCHFVWSR